MAQAKKYINLNKRFSKIYQRLQYLINIKMYPRLILPVVSPSSTIINTFLGGPGEKTDVYANILKKKIHSREKCKKNIGDKQIETLEKEEILCDFRQAQRKLKASSLNVYQTPCSKITVLLVKVSVNNQEKQFLNLKEKEYVSSGQIQKGEHKFIDQYQNSFRSIPADYITTKAFSNSLIRWFDIETQLTGAGVQLFQYDFSLDKLIAQPSLLPITHSVWNAPASASISPFCKNKTGSIDMSQTNRIKEQITIKVSKFQLIEYAVRALLTYLEQTRAFEHLNQSSRLASFRQTGTQNKDLDLLLGAFIVCAPQIYFVSSSELKQGMLRQAPDAACIRSVNVSHQAFYSRNFNNPQLSAAHVVIRSLTGINQGLINIKNILIYLYKVTQILIKK